MANDACYVSSVDKIFGVVGPYVVKYNATTGKREGSVRLAKPLYGEMRICYHAANDTLYVATWNQPNEQYFSPTFTWPEVDVFPVSTSLVVGSALGLGSIYTTQPSYNGFRWIASSGTYLYVNHSGYNNLIRRIDPTNLADRNSQTPSELIFSIQHGGLSPTTIVLPEATNRRVRYAILAFNLNSDWTASSLTPYNPVAVEYCASNGLFYVVNGDSNLLRIDVLTPVAFTVLNLAAIEATADPCRIRYRSSDQKLYLPCMTANAIIVWDPATDTGVSKTGFENPVDVVFTGSKAWAVQNSPIGLKEIT